MNPNEVTGKPEDEEWYDWDEFVKFARTQGVALEHIEDWELFWKFWHHGYICAMHNSSICP